jgi:multidrug efflux pump subunit AcrB
MNGFNLSDWALRHKSIVVYLMLVAAFAGLWAWGKLGREEDPAFTIKTMVVKTTWPGATTSEMLQQVTDRIEKKLEELPNLDFVRSYTKPGESVVFVNLKDTVSGEATKPLWYQVRKKIDDIRYMLPSGVNGPYFNDEFGDTYALIFALTGEGLSQRDLRDRADLMRAELLRVKDVAKVERPADGRARHRSEHADADTAGAECADAERRRGRRPRADRDPGIRLVHVGGKPEGDQLPL